MTDIYFNTGKCVDRLLEEYELHKRLMVAVDFDDTIFDFHNKGYEYRQVIDLLKQCQKLNFYITVFTGSPTEKYGMIQEYMEKIGIKITGINKNPIPLPFGNHGKIYFNILLDDRAGLGQAYAILNNVVENIKRIQK